MKKRHVIAAACAAFVATVAVAQSTVHRWVDKDGKVHFSDSPPPPDARNASSRQMGGGPVSTDLPYATQVAMKRHPVVLFVGADCGAPCASGRELLGKRGIPYTERDAGSNREATEELKKLIGAPEVPLLVVGESKVKGFDAAQWNGALDTAGYPRTRLPGPPPPVRRDPNPTPTQAPPPAGADKKQ